MQTYKLDDLVSSLKDRRIITFEDVMNLRRSFFMGNEVSETEAEALFDLNHLYTDADPAWYDFFVEALTEYCVHQTAPKGVISCEQASWFIEQCLRDGTLETLSELELLVTMMETAELSPATLVRVALEQVRRAVMRGTGPLRTGCRLVCGRIYDSEILLIRRILEAFGGGRAVAITRWEAEILLDINDALSDTDQSPSVLWADLFIKALANYVLAGSGYRVPERSLSLKPLEDLKSVQGYQNYLESLSSGDFEKLMEFYLLKTSSEVAVERLEQVHRVQALGEQSGDHQVNWFIERISAKTQLNDNEKAVLKILKQNAQNIDAAFLPLMELAA